MKQQHARALDLFKTQLTPLAPYIEDPMIQEIMVNSASDVWVERAGKMQRIEGLVIDDMRITAAIKALASANDKDVQPVLDARMPGYRIAAALYPVASKGSALCIRKHNASSKVLDDYLESGAFTPDPGRSSGTEAALSSYLEAHANEIEKGGKALRDFLAWCVRSKLNFLVAGATGSGKTTLMNALLAEIPHDERVLTLEDTAELKVRTPNHVGLEASEADGIDIRRLVRLSLRFRPDRIVVGEVRGGESYDLIDAMNTGHSGGGCTLHADSARLALYRMENMVRMSPSATNLPLAALRSMISQTFHIIIYCARTGGIRRPIEVALVENLRDEEYVVRTVYSA